MRIRLFSVRWMAVGALAMLPAAAFAQMPFSSTSAPGMNPFSRNNSLPPPAATPARSNGQAQPYAAGGNPMMPGVYPQATAVNGPVDPDHKLGPGDLLSYRVAEDRDEKVYQLTVTDSGEVELPLGSLRVKASGKTSPQLASDIKSTLEREYYKPGHATVSLGLISYVRSASKGKVYFTGEIASRGVIDLPADGQLTVYQAILQLGGFTQEADLKGVYIYRKGGSQKGIQVNCKAISNGDSSQDVVLQPGDTVKIKRRLISGSF